MAKQFQQVDPKQEYHIASPSHFKAWLPQSKLVSPEEAVSRKPLAFKGMVKLQTPLSIFSHPWRCKPFAFQGMAKTRPFLFNKIHATRTRSNFSSVVHG